MDTAIITTIIFTILIFICHPELLTDHLQSHRADRRPRPLKVHPTNVLPIVVAMDRLHKQQRRARRQAQLEGGAPAKLFANKVAGGADILIASIDAVDWLAQDVVAIPEDELDRARLLRLADVARQADASPDQRPNRRVS